LDVAHLPRSSNGFKYIFVMVERLTSYITALPLRTLKASSLSAAFRIFCGIFPIPSSITTDHGSEFSQKTFTECLASYGVEHKGYIAARSQQQGSAERAIGILKIQLGKLCSISDYGGRKNWHLVLPKVVASLNMSHPYKNTPLSRTNLLFSPFYFGNMSNLVEDPIKFQTDVYTTLNNNRIQGLLAHKNSGKVKHFNIGNFVLLEQDETKTVDDSRQLIAPRFQDVFKIIQIKKDGFAMEILNLRDGSIRSTTHNKIHKLSLTDLLRLELNPNKLF
jgi:hypothetical protein